VRQHVARFHGCRRSTGTAGRLPPGLVHHIFISSLNRPQARRRLQNAFCKIMEVGVDQVLGNQMLISRLRAGRTVDDYWSAIRDVPGLKVTLEREIIIEFVPER